MTDQHVLVLGLGDSGLAMARWCAWRGAQVRVADTREAPPQLATLRAEWPQVSFVAGEFGDALLDGITLVCKSPGLTPAAVAPLRQACAERGIGFTGELGLFVQALDELAQPPQGEDAAPVAEPVPEPTSEPTPDSDDGEALTPIAPPPPPPAGYHPRVLGVTGTNGKTTVTALTGLLVERAGRRVAVAGNIGPTLLDTLRERIDANDLPEVWVLELSSFQLDGIEGFEPTAATVLNLTQDHLDWHGDMDSYGAAKARIFGERGLMVLNRDDARVMAMRPAPQRVRGRTLAARAAVTFGLSMPERPGDFGLETVNGMTWLVRALEADETRRRRKDADDEIHIQRLMPAEALRIRGRHNAANALAALALATAAGCPLAPMLYGLREYRGEPHRVEPVGVVAEVEYFDDSKGTNVGATVAALLGLGAERRLVVILGGDGKGQDFSPLAEPLARHARAVVLIGRDGPAIGQAVGPALAAAGVTLASAASMDDAVRQCAALARSGDAVLMSPACASFDMFRNYPHRAEVFRAAVAALASERGELS